MGFVSETPNSSLQIPEIPTVGNFRLRKVESKV
jgi:hypothetical protein